MHGKAEIWNFSTSFQLDISQMSVVIFHILQAMYRRKIIKMVHFGKGIENEKKWDEKKLGPCMTVFINFDPYTTLDLLHPKQWLKNSGQLNRLWNGKMIKKWLMLKANSVTSGKANIDILMFFDAETNKLSKILEKGEAEWEIR